MDLNRRLPGFPTANQLNYPDTLYAHEVPRVSCCILFVYQLGCVRE